ncbi:MAG: nucleotidyltransferase domain-containing protein [Bryobacteraceae bacterium]
MFDWSEYTGNLSWIPKRTIFLAHHGSTAYGTSLPESDIDYRGVAVAPREFYLGGLHRFDQAVCNKPDLTIFDLRKFVSLASQCNPNVLEILFVDELDHLQVSAAGRKLLDARDLFVTRRVKHTFSGYAHSQMKRIDAHYRWLKHPPAAQPTRAEFGLPDRTLIPQDQLAAAESSVRKKLDSWSVDFLEDLPRDLRECVLQKMAEHLSELQIASNEELWKGAARTIGINDNFILILDMEQRYAAKKREWDNYQEWKRNRNPARAKLEANWGYDTKHAGHLVRLTRMCREILETGKVIVRRPDADELLAIRRGAWTYEQLREWQATEDAALEEVAAKSNLPKSPDVEAIDRMCVELIWSAIQ